MIRTALIALMLLLAGCSSQIGQFTVLSTHNCEMSRVDLKRAELGRHEGSSSRFWLLFIPFGREPSVDEAIDDCLDTGRGDYMLNARVYDNSWTCLLFSWGSYVVKGEVGLSTKNGARDVVDPIPQPAQVPPPPPLVSPLQR